MKAILIDPFARTISEVEYDGDYKSIYGFIDCDTFDCVRIGFNDAAIFVDDEGLINDKEQEFFVWKGFDQPLAGKGLILGADEDGGAVSPELTVEEAKAHITWLNYMGGGVFMEVPK